MLYSFEGVVERAKASEKENPGDDRDGVTPVSIPNTEVKPIAADGTEGYFLGRVGSCQDRVKRAADHF